MKTTKDLLQRKHKLAVKRLMRATRELEDADMEERVLLEIMEACGVRPVLRFERGAAGEDPDTKL